MFSCDFKRDTVRYEHSGNPLLHDDTVPLVIYQFSDASTTVERVLIPVTVTPPAYRVIVIDDDVGLSSLEVEAVEGAVTPPIDTQFLRFRYPLDGDPAPSCLLTYAQSTSTQPFPEVGQLVRGRTNEVVRNHTGDCHGFLFRDFKYRFSGSAAVDVDYLPLTVEVDDGRGSVVRETVYLRVVIRGGQPNSAPVLRVNRSQAPVVRQLTSLRFYIFIYRTVCVVNRLEARSVTCDSAQLPVLS